MHSAVRVTAYTICVINATLHKEGVDTLLQSTGGSLVKRYHVM